jgi:hypothetical protein
MNPMQIEYKYLVPNSLLNQLRKSFHSFVNLDDYAKVQTEKEYKVRSIYYDTMRLEDYADTVSGLKVRKKLRIRAYNQVNNESIVFLEVKRKYERHIFKNRAPLMYYNLDEILQTADLNRFLVTKKNYLNAQSDAVKFFYLLRIKNCSPTILVVYEREAFFSKYDATLRITFDKNLRSRALPKTSDLFNDAGLKPVMHDFFILEIKFFNGFPKWLQNILNQYGLQRKAISKYTKCVDNQYELKRYVYNKNFLILSPIESIKNNTWKEPIKNAG